MENQNLKQQNIFEFISTVNLTKPVELIETQNFSVSPKCISELYLKPEIDQILPKNKRLPTSFEKFVVQTKGFQLQTEITNNKETITYEFVLTDIDEKEQENENEKEKEKEAQEEFNTILDKFSRMEETHEKIYAPSLISLVSRYPFHKSFTRLMKTLSKKWGNNKPFSESAINELVQILKPLRNPRSNWTKRNIQIKISTNIIKPNTPYDPNMNQNSNTTNNPINTTNNDTSTNTNNQKKQEETEKTEINQNNKKNENLKKEKSSQRTNTQTIKTNQSENTTTIEKIKTIQFPQFTKGKEKLPWCDIDFTILLSLLDPSNIIFAMTSILNERRIVFVCSNISKITPVISALLCFIYPFEWPFAYIPLLPDIYKEILQAPTPYIIGCTPKTLKDSEIDFDVVIVDLDNNYISSNVKIIPLPKKLREKLCKTIRLRYPLYKPTNIKSRSTNNTRFLERATYEEIENDVVFESLSSSSISSSNSEIEELSNQTKGSNFDEFKLPERKKPKTQTKKLTSPLIKTKSKIKRKYSKINFPTFKKTKSDDRLKLKHNNYKTFSNFPIKTEKNIKSPISEFNSKDSMNTNKNQQNNVNDEKFQKRTNQPRSHSTEQLNKLSNKNYRIEKSRTIGTNIYSENEFSNSNLLNNSPNKKKKKKGKRLKTTFNFKKKFLNKKKTSKLSSSANFQNIKKQKTKTNNKKYNNNNIININNIENNNIIIIDNNNDDDNNDDDNNDDDDSDENKNKHKYKYKHKINFQILRKQCLSIFFSLFKKYKRFVIFPTKENTNRSDIFNNEEFLKNESQINHHFLKMILNTQLFISFIEKRILMATRDIEMDYFEDNAIKKMQRRSLRYSISRNSQKKHYFYKRGKRIKNWKYRYFVLTKNIIRYFYYPKKNNDQKKKKKIKEKGKIVLTPGVTKISIPKYNSNHYTKYPFEIITPSRTYLICAQSDEIRKSWVISLKAKCMKEKDIEYFNQISPVIPYKISSQLKQSIKLQFKKNNQAFEDLFNWKTSNNVNNEQINNDEKNILQDK
ncbi:c-myc promoter binding protein [Anaeramoeba flamelloides]|uniref:C-myc promoter binding protein n=1 Tax=Anaeramoeba flamelloides TaxID=1746091 RepID=A0ABQ8Y8M1_9EUKA|nr:c-myc promoter binding protein [Anaeramoeba flamelloides]